MTLAVEQPPSPRPHGVDFDFDGDHDGSFIVPEMNFSGNTFRDYIAESERKNTVEEFYRKNHVNQCYDFVSVVNN